MIFNLKIPLIEQLRKLKQIPKVNFLLPHHHLNFIDVVLNLWDDVRRLRLKFTALSIKGISVSNIFNDELRHLAFDPSMLSLNLIYPAIRKFKKNGLKIGSDR